MRRRATTICWLLFALGAGCGVAPPLADAGGSIDAGVIDALAYTRCSAICLRPSDCLQAYSSPDGYCPPGFLCSLQFSCSSDAGQ